MKHHLLYIGFLIITCYSCSKRVQVFETESVNIDKVDGGYLYEDSIIKVAYLFWNEKGILRFGLYNKCDRPIYIDWKKSCFINGTTKLNYWEDKTTSISTSLEKSLIYSDEDNHVNESIILKTLGGSLTSITKPERVTFIPPKTTIVKRPYYLYSEWFSNWIQYDSAIVARNDKPLRKKTVIFSKNFSEQNTPLFFRNYVTYSFYEDLREEHSLDNAFYISKIISMDSRHFQTSVQNDGVWVKKLFFYNNTSFYITE